MVLTVPRSSMVMIPSTAVSTTARSSASLSRSASARSLPRPCALPAAVSFPVGSIGVNIALHLAFRRPRLRARHRELPQLHFPGADDQSDLMQGGDIPERVARDRDHVRPCSLRDHPELPLLPQQLRGGQGGGTDG